MSASQIQGASNWYAMINRCDSPRATHYERYGGRGITVCDCLRVSIWNLLFVAGEKPSSKHTIERLDHDGHYSCGFCVQCRNNGWKQNVTWATRHEQSLNRSDTVHLTFNGVTKCMAQWADESGIDRNTFRSRLKAGRDPFTKVDMRRKLTIDGETKSVVEWAAQFGVTKGIMFWRADNNRDLRTGAGRVYPPSFPP